jgi:hypothetical protein
MRDVLAEGLDICREIARRPDLGPYEYHDPKLAGPDLDSRVPRRAVPDFATLAPPSPAASADPFSSNRSSRSSAPYDAHYEPSSSANPLAYGEPSGANNMKTPTSAEEEDEDLKRALEESRKEAAGQREYVPSLPSRPAPGTPSADDAASVNRRSRQRVAGLFGRN